MKKLATLSVLFPGAALAHGGHAPMPEAAHAATHLGPIIAIAVVALAAGIALSDRVRS